MTTQAKEINRNTSFDQLPAMLTPEEISLWVGNTHVRSVRRWITDGKLRAVKNGNRYLIPKGWLQEFLNEHHTQRWNDWFAGDEN